jgi:hypothetical protein
VNDKEENSKDFCLVFVQEFGLNTRFVDCLFSFVNYILYLEKKLVLMMMVRQFDTSFEKVIMS